MKVEVGEEQARKALLRYATTLGFQNKDKDALKKLLEWPIADLENLVNVLTKYRTYQTADSKVSDKNKTTKLKFGAMFPLTKTLFRKVSKLDPAYFAICSVSRIFVASNAKLWHV